MVEKIYFSFSLGNEAFVLDNLVENSTPELKIHISSLWHRGKMLVSRSWEKLNSVNLLFTMSQGQVYLNKVPKTNLERP